MEEGDERGWHDKRVVFYPKFQLLSPQLDKIPQNVMC